MEFIIIFVGMLIVGSGLVLLVHPPLIIGFIERRDESAWLYAFGIGVRLILGLLLIPGPTDDAWKGLLSVSPGIPATECNSPGAR